MLRMLRFDVRDRTGQGGGFARSDTCVVQCLNYEEVKGSERLLLDRKFECDSNVKLENETFELWKVLCDGYST